MGNRFWGLRGRNARRIDSQWVRSLSLAGVRRGLLHGAQREYVVAALCTRLAKLTRVPRRPYRTSGGIPASLPCQAKTGGNPLSAQQSCIGAGHPCIPHGRYPSSPLAHWQNNWLSWQRYQPMLLRKTLSMRHGCYRSSLGGCPSAALRGSAEPPFSRPDLALPGHPSLPGQPVPGGRSAYGSTRRPLSATMSRVGRRT